MMEFFGFNLSSLAQLITNHQVIAQVAIWLLTFTESLAILGMIMPGAITMPLVGFFIGTTILSGWTTILWATCGAICGDLISYFWGIKLQRRIYNLWPFTRMPQLLRQGEKFFMRHGGKSVFICRFIGPMRAVVPLIAGAFKLPIWRFMMASFPAAFIWAIVYMLPGIVLGAISLELPSKFVGKLLLFGLAAGIILWLSWWLILKLINLVRVLWDKCGQVLWKKLNSNPTFIKFFYDPLLEKQQQHYPLKQFGLILLLMGGLGIVTWQLFRQGILFELSRTVYWFLNSLHYVWLEKIFILLTDAGELPILLVITALVFGILLWRRQYRAAKYWFMSILTTGIVTGLCKLFLYFPRPILAVHGLSLSSFPSAHTTLSTVIYGFFAVIISRGWSKAARIWVGYIVAGLISVIGFSRLYLGAHWLLDVLAGGCLGGALLLFFALMYKRQKPELIFTPRFSGYLCVGWLLLWGSFGFFSFHQQMLRYHVNWPSRSYTWDQLLQLDWQDPEFYRLDRCGRPLEAINVLYLGDLKQLAAALKAQGWEQHAVDIGLKELLKRLIPQTVDNHLPILQQVYHNHGTSLLLTKVVAQRLAILRLWSSEFKLIGESKFSIWIGDVEWHTLVPQFRRRTRGPRTYIFDGATDLLKSDLSRDFFTVVRQVSGNVQGLEWDRQVLTVKMIDKSS